MQILAALSVRSHQRRQFINSTFAYRNDNVLKRTGARTLDADITLKAAVEQANLTMGIKAVGSMADQVDELISELGINPTAAPARKRPFANF